MRGKNPINQKKSNRLGFGIDIETISRFKKAPDSPFLKRIYTKNELVYCFGKKSPAGHLAGRFAAKESVIKAISALDHRPIDYNDIEIINDRRGVPEVALNDCGLADKYNFFLSISHTKYLAIAAAIVMFPANY